jgi:hypothetical protein
VGGAVLNFSGADGAAIAQNGDAIAQGQHFLELVADEDDGCALAGQFPQNLHQPCRFLGGEHGGGFIQNQHPGLAVQGFEDFDPLLFTHGKLPDWGGGVEVKAVALSQIRQPLMQLAGGLPQQATGATQDNVFGDGEAIHQHEVLMHHTDASGNGIRRAVKVFGLPVQPDFSHHQAGTDRREYSSAWFCLRRFLPAGRESRRGERQS